MSVKISASILSCDFLNLNSEIEKLKNANVDFIHLDIMDGHFVPNISFGLDISRAIFKKFSIPIGTHLMVSNPIDFIEDFKFSDTVVFHIESNCNVLKTIKKIKSLKVKVGIAISPKTDFELLIPYVDKLDSILVMSVKPGFGGQKFLVSQFEKIKKIKSYLNSNKKNISLCVDGGINFETAKICSQLGANTVVVGSFLVKNENKKDVCDKIRSF